MMKSLKREELAIRSVHRSLLTVLAVVVIIGGLFYINSYYPGLLGPIKGDINHDPALRWSVSDHSDNNGTSVLLKNSLTEPDVPKYDDENDHVIKLDRNLDGSLSTLPRIQGTLEFYKNNP